MNLVIDSGNTLTKYGLFKHDQMVKQGLLSEISGMSLENILQTAEKPDAAIISSVAGKSEFYLKELNQLNIPGIILDHHTSLPFTNTYKTPQTLGYDRIASAAGAAALYPNTDTLIIDAGTAITFDVLTGRGIFLGGNISPGARMRGKAMNTFTNKLPETGPEKNFTLLGTTTHEALVNGIMNGIHFEIMGYVNQLRNNYPDLLVILTGGDCHYFELPTAIMHQKIPDLALIGLNAILNFNTPIPPETRTAV